MKTKSLSIYSTSSNERVIFSLGSNGSSKLNTIVIVLLLKNTKPPTIILFP